MILLIDNYDSFSYNVYQLIGSVEPNIKVIRNDEMTVDEISVLPLKAIVLSPGPGRPSDAGICTEVVKKLGETVPILGICLGHQTICKAFGAKISYAKNLMHGKTSEADIDNNSKLFKGLKDKITVARYHSLTAERTSMPHCLKITAMSDDGEIMAVEHNKYNIFGVQFHPESVLTPNGKKIIENFAEVIER